MRKYFCIILALFISCTAGSENKESFDYSRHYEKDKISLNIEISKTEFKAAQAQDFNIEIIFPKSEEYYVANINKLAGPFLLLDRNIKGPSLYEDDLVRLKIAFSIEAKKPGEIILPGLELVNKADNKTVLISEDIKLNAVSVIDDQQAKDIMEHMVPMEDGGPVLLIIIISLSVLLILVLVFIKFRKKNKKEISVEDIYLKKLDKFYDPEIRADKELYYELDFLLREYLEKKYENLPLLSTSLTNEEIFKKIENISDLKNMDDVKYVFELSSKLKYTDFKIEGLKFTEIINKVSSIIKKGKISNA